MKKFIHFGFVVLLMVFAYIAEAQICPFFPYYSQLDLKWAKKQLGTCQGSTIGREGCVITCISMVLKYYDRNLDIDPGKLNDWLKRDNGYINGCEMIWSAPLHYVKNLKLETIAYTTKISDIDQYLFKFKPVMVKVSYFGLPHYVVVTSKFLNKYYIQDPNGSGKTLDYYKNSISRLVVYARQDITKGAPTRNESEVITTTWGAIKNE